MLKKTLALLLSALIISTSAAALAAPSSWAQDEVFSAISSGLVPAELQADYQQNITRKEFCKLAVAFYSKLKTPPEISGSTPFSDVDDSDITLAAQLGIVNGVGDGRFAPENHVTRQEMCVMLTRAVTAGNGTVPADEYACEYPDGAYIADWAVKSVGFMSVRGAIFGDENGNIMPLGNTTREQAMLFCVRLYNLLYSQSIDGVIGMFMPTTGTTNANLQFGSFAIRANGGRYYKMQGGVVFVSASGEKIPVVSESVKMMAADGEVLYYIKNSDSRIYCKAISGEEKAVYNAPARSFNLSGRGIYIVTESGTLLYDAEISGEVTEVAQGADFPTPHGAKVYFGGDGITVLENGGCNKIYNKKTAAVTATGEGVFFINADGLACRFNETSSEVSVLSSVRVRQIHPMKTALFALAENGSIYRIDYSGRGAVRLYKGEYTDINVEEKDLFAKNAAGEIFNLSPDAVKNKKVEL